MKSQRINLLFILLNVYLAIGQDLKRFAYSESTMGTKLNLIFYASDSLIAQRASHTVFKRIKDLNNIFSDYDQSSELNQLCDSYGVNEPIKVSEELFDILNRAKKVSQLTDGAFDVTLGVYTKMWRNAKKERRLPSEAQLLNAKRMAGYHNMVLNQKKKTVKFKIPGIQIDLGGIAKGYSADQVLKVLKAYQIEKALIDFGGDILVGDPPPNKNGWNIAINYTDHLGKYVSEILLVRNMAIATSGDHYQKLLIGPKTYSHIINPSTGLGITRSVQVTVIAPTGYLADSYASAFSVMPLSDTQKHLKKDTDIQVLISSKENNSINVWQSDRLHLFKLE